jgi:hypothetical protein
MVCHEIIDNLAKTCHAEPVERQAVADVTYHRRHDKARDRMGKIICSALSVGFIIIVFSACTGRHDCCHDSYNPGNGLNTLWDRHDCGYGHRYVVYPREFFDDGDFGYDGMYGRHRDWRYVDEGVYPCQERRRHRHEEYSRYHECPHARHMRHRGYDDYEGAVSERYVPAPVSPSIDYDE